MATYKSIAYDAPLSAGGSMVLLNTQTASSSSTISFTSGIDSTYKEYIFKFYNLHPSDSDNENKIIFNGSSDTGSNYNVTKTTSAFRSYHFEADNGEGIGYQTAWDLAQSTAFQELSEDLGYGNDENSAGVLHLYNPSDTTFVKHFVAETEVNYDTAGAIHSFIAGYFNTTSAVDAIQFKLHDGTIDAGTFKLYGVK